jgi:peptidoglycan hydrolase CwlO-like protein
MDRWLWTLPVLGCGLMMVMMVAMMFGMGKDMLTRKDKKPSIDELRSEQERLAKQIEALEGEAESPREREPASGAV